MNEVFGRLRSIKDQRIAGLIQERQLAVQKRDACEMAGARRQAFFQDLVRGPEVDQFDVTFKSREDRGAVRLPEKRTGQDPVNVPSDPFCDRSSQRSRHRIL